MTSRSFSRHPVLRAELLEQYPDVRFNDAGESLRGESLVAFLRGCEMAITALEPIDDALLRQLPELRVISGRLSQVRRMEEVIANHGREPGRWLPVFMSGSQS